MPTCRHGTRSVPYRTPVVAAARQRRGVGTPPYGGCVRPWCIRHGGAPGGRTCSLFSVAPTDCFVGLMPCLDRNGGFYAAESISSPDGEAAGAGVSGFSRVL